MDAFQLDENNWHIPLMKENSNRLQHFKSIHHQSINSPAQEHNAMVGLWWAQRVSPMKTKCLYLFFLRRTNLLLRLEPVLFEFSSFGILSKKKKKRKEKTCLNREKFTLKNFFQLFEELNILVGQDWQSTETVKCKFRLDFLNYKIKVWGYYLIWYYTCQVTCENSCVLVDVSSYISAQLVGTYHILELG